jgi:putative peptidoglycan lipid II flippase
VIGYLAAALAATLAGWVNLWLLARGLRGLDHELKLDPRLSRSLPRMAVAALLMGALALGMAELATVHLPGLRAATLAAIIVASILAYGLFATLFGAFGPRELLAMARRRKE